MKNLLDRTEKIAIFHTGRGGRFNNAGYREFKGFFDSFDAEYFGESIFIDEDAGIITDESGNEVCTVEEYNSNNGTLNLDNDYDKYDWKPVSELEESEISDFVYSKNGFSVEMNQLFMLMEQPKSIKLLMDLKASADDIAFAIYNSLDVDELVKHSIIEWNEEEEKYELY